MPLYQIHFDLNREITATVGRLGRFRFAPGHYFYTGSARRGLRARLLRHLARRKKRNWHIDYLLGRPGVEVDCIVVCDEEAAGGECRLHQSALAALSATTPVAGFGSSDCRGGCPSHLGRLKRKLTPASIRRRLAGAAEGAEIRIVYPRPTCPAPLPK